MPQSAPVPVRRAQPDPNEDPAQASAYINTLAQRYGDHWNRLSDDDKTLLNSIAMGHGQELLKMRVQQQEKTGSRTPESP